MRDTAVRAWEGARPERGEWPHVLRLPRLHSLAWQDNTAGRHGLGVGGRLSSVSP